MDLYKNISNRELPTLLRACYEQNEGDMEKAAEQIETIDMMLGVLKLKTLVNVRDRKQKRKNLKGRTAHTLIRQIIAQKLEKRT